MCCQVLPTIIFERGDRGLQLTRRLGRVVPGYNEPAGLGGARATLPRLCTVHPVGIHLLGLLQP